MGLESKIDSLRKDIKSDRLSMSVGELAGLYRRGEVDIHPKFQRVLRWDDGQKSRLVESILLRIPIPPIFVAQDAEGRWDVVDGVQRLGTIFEFLGILKDATGKRRPPLVLIGTHLLPELEGMQFKAASPKPATFPSSLQLDFNRSRLDLQILLKESDSSAKYELFERLNTGGSIASDQEVRNCVLVWINEALFDWLQDRLCGNADFRACAELAERAEEQQYRMEIVLRFLAFFDIEESSLRGISDIGEFLNEKNREIATGRFDQQQIGRTFETTFKLLNSALGPDAFRKYDTSAKKFRGGFLISAFEAVALGVAFNISKWRRAENAADRIRKLVRNLWMEQTFLEHIGIGVAARDRIRWSVPFGRAHFVP